MFLETKCNIHSWPSSLHTWFVASWGKELLCNSLLMFDWLNFFFSRAGSLAAADSKSPTQPQHTCRSGASPPKHTSISTPVRNAQMVHSKPQGQNWRFDIMNPTMIVDSETAGVWRPDCFQIIGQSLEHAWVHAEFGLHSAISIEYYLPGPYWRLTATHRCPRTDTLIAVPPMSTAVRSTTDTMIWPAAVQKQNNELSSLSRGQQLKSKDAPRPGASSELTHAVPRCFKLHLQPWDIAH